MTRVGKRIGFFLKDRPWGVAWNKVRNTSGYQKSSEIWGDPPCVRVRARLGSLLFSRIPGKEF